MIGNSPEVLNFNQLFLKLNRFINNQPPVLSQAVVGEMIDRKTELLHTSLPHELLVNDQVFVAPIKIGGENVGTTRHIVFSVTNSICLAQYYL